MKPLKLLAVAWLLNSVASQFTPNAQAQEAQKWKSFQQTFSVPKDPRISQIYEHQVSLESGKFITKFSRRFSPGELFTGTVTTNLAEIDTTKLQVVKGKEGYRPDYWYLYVSVKNPTKAPERKLATPQTDRNKLIIKDQVANINGRVTEETWVLTKMYLNFDNDAAARQASADILTACR